jgi:predicted deacetylase
MSSPIMPIEDLLGPTTDTPIADSNTEDIATFVSEMATDPNPLMLAASRGGPPQDLLEQIAAAAWFEERLREGGHHLRFHAEAHGAPLRIELHDRDGNAVRALSTAEALELAAGVPLE